MSDDLLEPETPVAPPPAAGNHFATILGILLLLVGIGFGVYVGAIWQSHNSRVARLKARNGDFVQLDDPTAEDEDVKIDLSPESKEAQTPGDGTPTKSTSDSMSTTLYNTYVAQLFPKPVHVIYWKDPDLKPEDIELIREFKDLQQLTVRCESIDGATVQQILDFPKLRKVRIQANKLDTAEIKSWKADKRLKNMTLVNPNWERADIRKLQQEADENETLKEKVNATNSTRPAFG